MESAQATMNFVSQLAARDAGFDLAALFSESLKRLSQQGLTSNEAICQGAAKDLRKRLAEELDLVERNLDKIDFGVLVEEAMRATHPLRIRIGSAGKAKLILAMDIGKEAERIASTWREKARLKQMMAACAATGKAEPVKIGNIEVSCERPGPPLPIQKTEGAWAAVRQACKNLFKEAKRITLVTIASVWMISTVHANLPANTVLPPNDLAIAFQRDVLNDVPYPTDDWKEELERTVHDSEFDRMLKEDSVLSFFMQRVADVSLKDKCFAVNAFWNNLAYQVDDELYGESEYWASPSEMWQNQAGDCEDYALAKYAMLRKLGVPAEDMNILVVRKHDSKIDHAVLSVRVNTEKGREVYILDLHSRMLTAEKAAKIYKLKNSVAESGVKVYTAQRHRM